MLQIQPPCLLLLQDAITRSGGRISSLPTLWNWRALQGYLLGPHDCWYYWILIIWVVLEGQHFITEGDLFFIMIFIGQLAKEQMEMQEEGPC